MQDVNMYQESDLNEIIDMLESHGYGKEKLYLENLLETIHSMEEKIAKTDAALMKLAAQIFQLQDTIERSMIVDSANNLFSTVEKAKRGLARIKRGLSAEASKIIASVQNGSKEVLGTAIAKLRVPQCLRAIQKICQKCEMAAMKGNETLSTIRNELHAVNTHIRNAGKVIIGSPLQSHNTEREDSKGLLHALQCLMRKTEKSFAFLKQRIEKTLLSAENSIEKKDQIQKNRKKRLVRER